jgi:hypothetical protein
MTDSLATAAATYPTSPAAPPHSARRRSSLASGLALLAADEAESFRYLLVLRFGVVNLVAVALLAAAWLQGWVTSVLAGDSTQLVLVIAAVFAYGLASSTHKIVQTSADINQIKEPTLGRSARVRAYLAAMSSPDGQSRALAAAALKLKLSSRIAPIRNMANSLVFLGLIGTVIGFIIALSGVDAETAADVDAIGPMVSTLISGMSVPLYTTLVGAILNIWLMVAYRLLESGTITLLTTIVEEGERHARS